MDSEKFDLIAARILTLIGRGMPVRQAIDAVLGAGAFERLGIEIYQTLRSKAA